MKDNSYFDNSNGIDNQMNMNSNPLEGEDDLVMEKMGYMGKRNNWGMVDNSCSDSRGLSC